MEVPVLIALWAFVWVEILTKPGEIFAAVPVFLSRFIHGDCDGPDWMRCQAFKAAVGCAKCHAGQVAFWWTICHAESLQTIFAVTVLSIFIAEFLTTIYHRLKR